MKSLLRLLVLAAGVAASIPANAQQATQKCGDVPVLSRGAIQEKTRELHVKEADLKVVAAASADPVAKSAAEAELKETRSDLVDLLFQSDCYRADLVTDILRGPTDPPPKWVEITTYFATNRKPTGDATPAGFFGAERQPDAQLGRTVVSIPTARQPGTMPLPSLWKFEVSGDPAKHFLFKSVVPLGTDEATQELGSRIAQSDKKSMLVFVHGYNVSFSDAALRTAQLAHDLAFPGIAMFFSWPSAASTRGYWRDEETVPLSTPAFDKFLDTVASVGATDMYVVAHSMGNRLVTSVLSDRAKQGRLVAGMRELFLAAPDINVEFFKEQIVPNMAKLTGVRGTIYASSSDLALRASKVVHDYRRVGETEGGVQTYDGFETIDASKVSTALRAFGHSYIVDSSKVLSDMAETLTIRLGADQRNLAKLGSPPANWWEFK